MKRYPENSDYVRRNEQIRHNRVLVVYDGNKLGEMSSRDAQFKARELGLDLVEVAPNARPPVCSIMDYGKFQYEKSKKQPAPSVQKEKEFVLRYVIDDHDLLTKMNQAKRFLEKGDRVKIIIRFKARENAHRDEGWVVIDKAVNMLAEVGSPEKPPAMDGNRIVVKMVKKK